MLRRVRPRILADAVKFGGRFTQNDVTLENMKSKQIVLLGIIFAVLVLGVCVKELQKPKELSQEEYVPLHFSFDAGAIEKLELSQADKKLVELVKENGQWRIPGLSNARADQKKAGEFLKEIQQAKGEVRANDPALLGDFGLGGDQALRVSLFEKNEKLAARFLIGTQKADSGFVFLRFENSDTIYLAQADLLTPMKVYGSLSEQKPSADSWAALNPFDFETSQVIRLEAKRFQKEKENLTVAVEAVKEGDEKKWQSLKKDVSFKIASEKIEEFLFSLANVQAAKVLDPKGFTFETPVWQMQLKLETGKEIIVKAIREGQEAENTSSFILQVSTEPVLFKISTHYFETLDIEDKQFAPEEPKTPEQPKG